MPRLTAWNPKQNLPQKEGVYNQRAKPKVPATTGFACQTFAYKGN